MREIHRLNQPVQINKKYYSGVWIEISEIIKIYNVYSTIYMLFIHIYGHEYSFQPCPSFSLFR